MKFLFGNLGLLLVLFRSLECVSLGYVSEGEGHMGSTHESRRSWISKRLRSL